ncbi:MAG: hypothetical protein NT037_11310 [Hyphomicrobiales bacterium]|nr:hypothetical protein [Hyphomicrobiales bacterium]
MAMNVPKAASSVQARPRAAIMHIAQRRLASRNASQNDDAGMAFGEHLCDNVAKGGGSWFLVSKCGVFLAAWALLSA